MTEATASLNRKLDAADRAKVDDYLDSVREVEQRVEKLKESSESLANLPDAPIGAPDDFGELLDVQFELFALAWETNRTNVVTMKMVEEASMRRVREPRRPRRFPPDVALGRLSGAHREPAQDPELPHGRVREVRAAPGEHAGRRRLGARPFDHPVRQQHGQQRRARRRSAAGSADRARRRLKGNQHLHYQQDTPLANLLVTMLDRAGVPAEELEKFGDATGPFSEV